MVRGGGDPDDASTGAAAGQPYARGAGILCARFYTPPLGDLIHVVDDSNKLARLVFGEKTS